MKKRSKKGFTLVELLVVIGILAVLAVVSVVGYFGFIKKANISNDVSLTTQLNTILQANETTDGKNKYPHEAVEELVDGGFDVTKFTPTTEKYNYVYDLSQNRVFLLDESYTVVAPSDLTLSTNKETVFGFASSQEEVTKFNNAGYSVYLKNTYNSDSITTCAGVDLGENESVETINFTSSEKKDYLFRTNNNVTLNVNAGNATVKHYESAKKVNIEAVAGESYHEFGNVSNIEIKSGRVVIEKEAEVSTVLVTGNDVKVESEVKDVEVKAASGVTPSEVKVGGEVKTAKEVILASDSNVTVQYGVTKINGKALNENDNVVLNGDINKQLVFKDKKNITIDLNGYNIKNPNQLCYGIYKGTIVLIRSEIKFEGSGLIESNNDNGFDVKENSILVVNEINVKSKEFALWFATSSSVTINSGTFTSYDNAVLGTDGTETKNEEYFGKNTITINGGTFNGFTQTDDFIACGIYAANDDTWNVNGGTFNITNGCGILARSGTVNVSKNVVINLYNNENNNVTGYVGNSTYGMISGAALIEDHVSNYPGGTPNLINNSSYSVTKIGN